MELGGGVSLEVRILYLVTFCGMTARLVRQEDGLKEMRKSVESVSFLPHCRKR
jgi:hypothetical protein